LTQESTRIWGGNLRGPSRALPRGPKRLQPSGCTGHKHESTIFSSW